MADAKGKKGQARQVFRDVVNETANREKIQALVDNILSMESHAWSFCPNCRKQVQAPIPDLKGRIAGLIQLLEQAEGKPEGETGGVNIVVRRVLLRGEGEASEQVDDGGVDE